MLELYVALVDGGLDRLKLNILLISLPNFLTLSILFYAMFNRSADGFFELIFGKTTFEFCDPV